MNNMKKLLMLSALFAVSSTAFASMTLELDNEEKTAQTVTFGTPLADGRTSVEVPAGQELAVVVSDAWKGKDVVVHWANGDNDTVHFSHDGVLQTSSDDENDGKDADKLAN